MNEQEFARWVYGSDETLEDLYNRLQKSEVTGDVMVFDDQRQESFVPEEDRLPKPEIALMLCELRALTERPPIRMAQLAGVRGRRAKAVLIEPEYQISDGTDENHNDGEEQTHRPYQPQTETPRGYPGDGLWG